MSEGEDFKKQRQIMTINIRKQKRQQNFQKKRKIVYQQEQDDIFHTQNNLNFPTYKQKHCILDQQRREIIEKAIDKKYFPNMFSELVTLLYSNDINQKHQGIIGIRKIVSASDTPPTHLIFQYQLLDYIIELLKQNTFPHLRLEATWIVSNIAASPERQYINALMEKNILTYLIQFLVENKQGLADQAIWGVGNISGDSPEHRDNCIQAGVIPAVIHFINTTTSKSNIIQAAWALSNLCRGTPLPNHQKVKQTAPIFCKIFEMNILDPQNLSDCLWAFSYLLEGPKIRLNYITNQETIKKIIQFAKSSFPHVAIPALRILGTISTGNQNYTELLLKHGILDAFEEILDSPKSVIRREVCWIFSNIAAGSKSQIDRILQNNSLMDKILTLFQLDSSEVKRQICYIFANFTYLGDKIKVRDLLLKNQIMRFYGYILIEQVNEKLVENCLDTLPMLFDFGEKLKPLHDNKNIIIEKMLSYPGVRECIEQLQHHDSERIYFKTIKILQTYFDLEHQNKQMDAEF